MRIGVAGKGGAGKTTIAATLARALARDGRRVLAIDGDSNPNLGVALGVASADALVLPGLPSDLLQVRSEPDGGRRFQLAMPVGDIAARHGSDAPDGVRLLVASRIDHAGVG